jgi:polyisoprenoid-binding protein YceI
MPLLILFILLLGATNADTGSLLICRNATISLFSEAPLENIEARTGTGVSVLNVATRELQFTVPIRSFDFKKKLMQEHFNENYMESDKYPNAKFKGKFLEEINLEKDGDYPVTVTGELEVHGVKRQRTIKGLMKIRDKKLSLSSTFDVKCQDHNIKIPQIVFQKIAETIRVKVDGSYSAYNP